MATWLQNKKPIIGLSPMADYTDKPFSLLCKKFGAQIIFREMVSADAIVHANPKTLKMIEIDKAERPLVQQIFGNDPKIMAEAAKIIYETAAPDGIDINMGCPAHKVTKNFHGAVLMKEPNLAQKIVEAVKKAVSAPVSVKTRLGWYKKDEILKFAPLIEAAGADAITVHGRTKIQGYAGDADWEMITRVKQILTVPVLANGSIFSPRDIETCLKITKADGVLIARGAIGNPWIFQRREKETINLEEIKRTILKHAKLQVEHYGEYGMILFRKHLLMYFKGLPRSKEIKQKLTSIASLEELEKILKEI